MVLRVSSGDNTAGIKIIVLICLFFVISIPAVIHADTPPCFLAKWGSFGSADGQFGAPYALDYVSGGYIYVADTGNSRVAIYDTSGAYISQWNGEGYLNQPVNIGADSAGNIYTVNHYSVVLKHNSTGTYIMQLGGAGSGDGQFNGPQGIAFDSSSNVYIADRINNRIQKFSPSGTLLAKWGGLPTGTGNGQFNEPFDVAVDASDNVYVLEFINCRVQKFDSSGNYITKWGSFGFSSDGQFNYPYAIAVDGYGNVYVADTGNQRIQKFSNTGTFLTKWGNLGSSNGQFNLPSGIATDPAGNVFVSDGWGNNVQKFGSCESPTITPTVPSPTPVPTGTVTSTATLTKTVTQTITLTVSSTITKTRTITQTVTITPTFTPTPEPLELTSEGAFPNPVKEVTNIVFRLSCEAEVKVTIYTVSGEKVRVITGSFPAGHNSVEWPLKNAHGSFLSSGVYIYKIRAQSAAGNAKETTGKICVIQ